MGARHLELKNVMLDFRPQDCNNLETFLNTLGGGKAFRKRKAESGKENPYSCVVLAGGRAPQERRAALQARMPVHCQR